jgi:polysaccharide export outer membrane protein
MKGLLVVLILSLLVILSIPITATCQEYVVGEGDLLKITVYDHADLTTTVRIGGDGKVTVPLIGEVYVNGMTTTQVEKEIARLLADGYIKNPYISVFISEYKSKKLTVLGEFTKPGLLELRGDSTLLEVISNAGGITVNAGDTLYIQRKILKGGNPSDAKTEITITVDLKKLLEEGDVSVNLPVQDGDSIYIPRASFIYVTGEVSKPGAYKLERGTTVLKAITLAGGFTEKASKGRVKVIRKVDNNEVTLKANLNDMVMADDIILVPESFF